ncbi:50S ribosomal protein L33 [bacterium F11]|nr:50S ribosomal protein L33 [bacterium F11]
MAERNVVGLKCTETGDINYHFEKGKKKGERKKIEIKKYSSRLRRHTLHREVKLSK